MPSPSMPFRVTASELDVDHEQIWRIARARKDKWAGQQAIYGLSTLESNYVGLLGEIACRCWFERAGHPVAAEYEQFLPPSEPSGFSVGFTPIPQQEDLRIEATGMLVEVKTFRSNWWHDHGPLLAAGQMRSILRNDVLVWCVTGPEVPTNAAYVMGWVSTPALAERVYPVIVRGRVQLPISALEPPVRLRL